VLFDGGLSEQEIATEQKKVTGCYLPVTHFLPFGRVGTRPAPPNGLNVLQTYFLTTFKFT
jgi:hypothetical protein